MLAFICLCACNGPAKNDGNVISWNGTIKTTIDIPAGEMLPQFGETGIPSFFNVGHIGTSSGSERMMTIVLSERLGSGKQVEVKPLSLFSFYKDSTLHQFLVSSDVNLKGDRIGDDFNSFMGKNNELQMAIENWFKAQCGLGGCTLYEWKNSYKALRELN